MTETTARAQQLPQLVHICQNHHIDSTRWDAVAEIPVYCQQEHGAYNGHFESTCYHPLLLFNREGDCLAAKLRPGNVHSAEDRQELLLPRSSANSSRARWWSSAPTRPSPNRSLYAALEQRGAKYAIRLPANDKL
jgi:hypothetical protein